MRRSKFHIGQRSCRITQRRSAFRRGKLSTHSQQPIEFLKSLQILPPSATLLAVDENANPKPWPVAWRAWLGVAIFVDSHGGRA